MTRILYMTDKFKVSAGYKPAFERLVNKAGIHRHQIVTSDIYNLVETPLIRKGQEKVWRANPEKLDQIRKALDQRIAAVRPTMIVVSCPAVLAVLGVDLRSATLEKMRGGVYEYAGITTIVVYPITAINQRVDARVISNDDGEEDTQQPYRVKDGAQILAWDWSKVGRFAAGKQRQLPPFRYSICRTLDDCFAARDYLRETILISTDVETGCFPPQITCAGFTGLLPNGACHTFVIPFYDEFAEGGTFWDSVDDHGFALDVVRDILNLPIPKVMHNGSYDASYFIRELLGCRDWILDTMLMWWSLYMEMRKSLDFVSSVLLDNYQYWKDDIKGAENEKLDPAMRSMERYWRYNGLDCYNTLWNSFYLLKLMMSNQAMRTNYNDAFMRLATGLRMSMRGIKADFQRRREHRDQLMDDMMENVRLLRYVLDEPDFNISSGPQKCSLLYDVFGLPERTRGGRYVDHKKEIKGANAPSGGKIPIRLAKAEHPLFRYILDILDSALEPRVQLSNLFGYPDSSAPGGIRGGHPFQTDRFRFALNSVGTETARYSGKSSNFWDGGQPQNIRGEYKDWLVPDENHIFLDVDFSQSDDVFISYESQDPDKIRVIEEGLDAHAVNGAIFFGIEYDKIVEGKRNKESWCVHPILGVRQNAKRAGHGSNFQMAAMTLYVTMGREAVVACAEILGFEDAALWDQKKLVDLCGQLMLRYRRKYKRLNQKEWYAEIATTLKQTRQITNCFGITRTFLGDPADSGTQREATAFIGQSATAGNMNRTMYEIDHGWIPERFRDGPNPDARAKPLIMDWESHGFGFHLQVHDNFLTQLNLGHPRWREAASNLLTVMNRPVIIKGREVRVKAEAELGVRWGKKMFAWDGNVDSLDRIVAKLKFG